MRHVQVLLGQRIRKARAALGSQTKAAVALGVSQSRLSEWERGMSAPSVVQLVRLCALTGSRPDELLQDSLPGPLGDDVLLLQSDDAAALLHLARRLRGRA